MVALAVWGAHTPMVLFTHRLSSQNIPEIKPGKYEDTVIFPGWIWRAERGDVR